MQKLAALCGPALLFPNNSHVARFEQEFVVSAGQWCSVLNAAIRCTRRSYLLVSWRNELYRKACKTIEESTHEKMFGPRILMDSDIHPST